MSNYSQKSFDACMFHPLSGEKMTDAYPALWEIVPDTLTHDGMLDKIIRYVIMVYDPKSPVIRMERDLIHRKGVAAELAGLPIETEEFMSGIYMFTYHGILDMTCKYLVRFARSKEWAAICAYEYKFWEAIRLIMQPIATDKSDKEQLDAANKKDVLSVSIDQGLTKLNGYYKIFFGEDDELELRAKKRMTPELMAKKEA